MITFSVIEGAEPNRGKLVYRPAEYSFDFVHTKTVEFARRQGSPTSLLIGYLQIEVGIETGFLLYVWGLHGHHLWKQDFLPEIRPKPGIVKAHFDREMKMGVSVRIVEHEEWISVHDPSSGWVYIGPNVVTVASDYVEFADNTVAALTGDRLVSLWLRPQLDAPIDPTSGVYKLCT
jgi:hypothetical protein